MPKPYDRTDIGIDKLTSDERNPFLVRTRCGLASEEWSTFTERGVESLKEFPTDIRTWEGGVRQSLVDEQCDPEKIERFMADEPKS